MKKNKVLASKFIKWFYYNHEDEKMLGSLMLCQLLRTGQCSLSVQEVFDGCNYVPKYICEDISEDMYTTD